MQPRAIIAEDMYYIGVVDQFQQSGHRKSHQGASRRLMQTLIMASFSLLASGLMDYDGGLYISL